MKLRDCLNHKKSSNRIFAMSRNNFIKNTTLHTQYSKMLNKKSGAKAQDIHM